MSSALGRQTVWCPSLDLQLQPRFLMLINQLISTPCLRPGSDSSFLLEYPLPFARS